MKFKKIDNDTSASDSQGHLTWFICVYPVADVIHDSQPEVTKGVGIVLSLFRVLRSSLTLCTVISKTLDEAVRVLGTRYSAAFLEVNQHLNQE